METGVRGIIREMFEPYIMALKEDGLLAGAHECYRMIWIRTFHPPVALRLDVADDDSGVLRIRRTDGMGGFEPGNLVVDRWTVIAPDVIDRLRTMIEVSGLRGMRTSRNDLFGIDGATWIIEALASGEHLLVARWAPRDGPVHDIGMELMRLSGEDFDPVY